MWSVRVVASKARKQWSNLEAEVQQGIEQALIANPFGDRNRPKAHKHLKAELYCKREYRRLAGDWRVFYSVDKSSRTIGIFYIGPHP